jgi:hypothetical protein
MNLLSKKRVLLIAPRFFGYEEDIRDELSRNGAIVDWLPDRPFETPLMKAITKVRPELVFPAADKIYRKRLDKIGASHYDILFVVNGQTLSQKTLKRLRIDYPNAKFVLYLWDAIANREHICKIFPIFDRILTFDPIDAVTYGLVFRPLFYGPKFSNNNFERSVTKFEISFVGTAHSDRFIVVDRLRASLAKEVRAYWYLYLQAPWVMHYYRISNPDMRHAQLTDFKFATLSRDTLQSVFAESNTILDIEHPHQRGLTIRTFESLGAGKKLVTTNAGIREYDFYSVDNICIIDRNKPKVPDEFLFSPFEPISSEIQMRYTVTGWLVDVLCG